MTDYMPRVLVIDDKDSICEQLKWSLSPFEVITATNRKTAIAQFNRFLPPVVTLDLGLPPNEHGPTEGLSILSDILSIQPATKVILVTGQDDQSVAIESIKMGAYDFYPKPIAPDYLKVIVERAWYLYQLEQSVEGYQKTQCKSEQMGIISQDEGLLKSYEMIEKVAPTQVSVLLLGESGTGKEIFAKALHDLSDRKSGPFLAINCSAIPESLLESELFGYEAGAFTGAAKRYIGKIEQADKGTLFLDEIGDMPMSLQPKLLRFLQEKTINRLGGTGDQAVDVRILGATHQNLMQKITAQAFREDLYYRLSEITIEIPALRKRGQDVILLARYFLHQYNKQYQKTIKGFHPEALTSLEQYQWPGNIRELENCIRRAVIVSEQGWIQDSDLGLPISQQKQAPLLLKEVRYQAEKKAIQRALNYANHNMSKAADLLGITRSTLYDLIEKLGLRETESIE